MLFKVRLGPSRRRCGQVFHSWSHLHSFSFYWYKNKFREYLANI